MYSLKSSVIATLAVIGLLSVILPVKAIAYVPDSTGWSAPTSSSTSTASAGTTDCSSPATVQEQLQCGANSASGEKNPNPDAAAGKVDSIVEEIINILTIIVGVIAVIMIIIGGLRYITSGGDSNKVSSAKNTILYAIIGLVIVALAQVIVRFVLNKTT